MAGSENKGSRPAKTELSLASLSVHADDGISTHRAVAPAMHVSTTFRYSDDPDNLIPDENVDVGHSPSSTPVAPYFKDHRLTWLPALCP